MSDDLDIPLRLDTVNPFIIIRIKQPSRFTNPNNEMTESTAARSSEGDVFFHYCGMNVLIVNTNRSTSPNPVLPSGACLVADAAARAGHRVDLLDLLFKDDPLTSVKNQLRQNQYDVIGLSVRNIDNNDLEGTKFYVKDLLPIISELRSVSDAKLVLGGAALGVMPRDILRFTGIECGVVGEGEQTFCRLLERLGRKEGYADLPGLCVYSNGDWNVNPSLPVQRKRCPAPDYQRWLDLKPYRSHLATMPLQTKLGCQFRCVYCTYRKIEGEQYRISDPESVAEAAVRLTSSGFDDIEFVDNVFNAPYAHAMELCESFIRSGVKARFQSLELNPAYFSDELILTMERAGFVGIGLTVESASDPVLYGLRKGFTAHEVHHAAEIVARHDLPCVWIFMLGGPGETRETVLETLRFAEKHIRPSDAAFFNVGIRIYPGTELESIARGQGVLVRPKDEMLEPVFYMSPDVDVLWVKNQVLRSMTSHMNFMSADTFTVPYLPLIHGIAYRLGLRSPLWRYTRQIRRGLRSLGLKV